MNRKRLRKRIYRRKKTLRKKKIHKQSPTDWNAFIDLNIRAAEEIRNELKIDEESFLFVHGQSWADASAYVVYTALGEVQKMAIYLLRIKEYIEEQKIDPKFDRLQRLTYEEIIEDQQSKIRRLLEILIVLILFNKINEQDYYRHYMHLEELQKLINSNNDLDDFYSARSKNIDDSIQLQKNWISKIESTINIQNCWYLREKVNIQRQQLNRGLLSTMRKRISLGLPYMTTREKLLFGFSYKGAFGLSSESLHYSSIQKFIAPGEKNVSLHSYLGLLGFSIIKRIADLLGNPQLKSVNQIINSLRRTSPDELVYSATVRNIKVGDYVLAYGDLAEVLEIKESVYGYRSYHILYLAEKPKPEIQEDWFPARYIQRIFDGDEIKKKVLEKLKIVNDSKETGFTELDWNKILRKSVIEIWNIALRDYIKNRTQPKK